MPGAVDQLKQATSQISSGASTLNSGVNQYTNGVDSAAAVLVRLIQELVNTQLVLLKLEPVLIN